VQNLTAQLKPQAIVRKPALGIVRVIRVRYKLVLQVSERWQIPPPGIDIFQDDALVGHYIQHRLSEHEMTMKKPTIAGKTCEERNSPLNSCSKSTER
jgi:hypothetical protein